MSTDFSWRSFPSLRSLQSLPVLCFETWFSPAIDHLRQGMYGGLAWRALFEVAVATLARLRRQGILRQTYQQFTSLGFAQDWPLGFAQDG